MNRIKQLAAIDFVDRPDLINYWFTKYRRSSFEECI